MKPKITVLTTLAAFLMGMGLLSVPGAGAAVSLKAPSPGTFSAKKCEKCRRGDDGKMVCQPVPCP